jgi:hypothetical protein
LAACIRRIASQAGRISRPGCSLPHNGYARRCTFAEFGNLRSWHLHHRTGPCQNPGARHTDQLSPQGPASRYPVRVVQPVHRWRDRGCLLGPRSRYCPGCARPGAADERRGFRKWPPPVPQIIQATTYTQGVLVYFRVTYAGPGIMLKALGSLALMARGGRRRTTRSPVLPSASSGRTQSTTLLTRGVEPTSRLTATFRLGSTTPQAPAASPSPSISCARPREPRANRAGFRRRLTMAAHRAIIAVRKTAACG